MRAGQRGQGSEKTRKHWHADMEWCALHSRVNPVSIGGVSKTLSTLLTTDALTIDGAKGSTGCTIHTELALVLLFVTSCVRISLQSVPMPR